MADIENAKMSDFERDQIPTREEAIESAVCDAIRNIKGALNNVHCLIVAQECVRDRQGGYKWGEWDGKDTPARKAFDRLCVALELVEGQAAARSGSAETLRRSKVA